MADVALPWAVEHVDVIEALTGEWLIQVETAQKSLMAVYEEVNEALNNNFVFRLVDGTRDLGGTWLTAEPIRGPLKLVKVRRKGGDVPSLHRVLRRMEEMHGSRNARALCAKVPDSADELHPLAACVYRRLFSGTSEGYIVQARMMILHTLITSHHELPSEDAMLAELAKVDSPDAITLLIRMHTQGAIELSRERFGPLADEFQIHLR